MVSPCWYITEESSTWTNLLEYIVISTWDLHQKLAMAVAFYKVWKTCFGLHINYARKPTYDQHKIIFTKSKAFVMFNLSLEWALINSVTWVRSWKVDEFLSAKKNICWISNPLWEILAMPCIFSWVHMIGF